MSYLIYVWWGERRRNKGRKSQSRGNGEWAADGAKRNRRNGRLLNIIFSARENFSLFRSPTIVAVAVAVIFSRGQEREEERRNFPFLRFRFYVPTACSRGTRRATPLLVLSFVNLDERSRLGDPPSFLFFSSSPRCRRPSRRRWEAYAMMLFSLAERERRRQEEKIRRNLTEDAWVRVSAWNRRDLLLRNFSRNQIARTEREGSSRVFVASIWFITASFV